MIVIIQFQGISYDSYPPRAQAYKYMSSLTYQERYILPDFSKIGLAYSFTLVNNSDWIYMFIDQLVLYTLEEICVVYCILETIYMVKPSRL